MPDKRDTGPAKGGVPEDPTVAERSIAPLWNLWDAIDDLVGTKTWRPR